MDAHIFVDNSNMFWGAQRAASTLEPGTVSIAVRLYFRNFARLIESGFTPVTRVLAGSVPPGNDDLWDHARRCGYNADLLKKVESDDGRFGEQGVDELAHLKIANALLDHDPPQTLVICTGDGQVSDFGTSFTQQLQRALKRGWDVVVWSWSAQLSGNFARIQRPSGRTVDIRTLDQYYNSITFVRAGSYQIQGRTVAVAARVVHELP
jgi:hypothetical protein